MRSSRVVNAASALDEPDSPNLPWPKNAAAVDGGALIRRRYRHLYWGEAVSHVVKLDALVRDARQPTMDAARTS